MSPSSHLWFFDAKRRLFDQNYKSLWFPDLTCRFVHAKQRDLQQYDKSILVPALIWVFFSCKTSTLGPDLQVCLGPRQHLWFWAHITACLAEEYKDSMGSSPHLWFCACKIGDFSIVSIGPSSHLWFLYAKQRLVDQHTSLYAYQTSPVVLCIKISVISTRITRFYGFHPSSAVL